MIYYEFWDKNERELCLGKMAWYKFFIVWLYAKLGLLYYEGIEDFKRVPKSKIKFEI